MSRQKNRPQKTGSLEQKLVLFETPEKSQEDLKRPRKSYGNTAATLYAVLRLTTYCSSVNLAQKRSRASPALHTVFLTFADSNFT